MEGDEGTPPFWHIPFTVIDFATPPPAGNLYSRLDARTSSETSPSSFESIKLHSQTLMHDNLQGQYNTALPGQTSQAHNCTHGVTFSSAAPL
jgi:hypothetical protein